MPSVSFKQHKYWVYVLHSSDTSDKEKATAREFLDADKKLGIWQDKCPGHVVGVIRRNDKYLLLFNNKLNIWTSPGGKTEDNESHFQALQRELKEEVGITVIKANQVFSGKIVGSSMDISFYLFVITDFSGEPVNSEPKKHSDMRWLTKTEVNHFKRLNLLGSVDTTLLNLGYY